MFSCPVCHLKVSQKKNQQKNRNLDKISAKEIRIKAVLPKPATETELAKYMRFVLNKKAPERSMQDKKR